MFPTMYCHFGTKLGIWGIKIKLSLLPYYLCHCQMTLEKENSTIRVRSLLLVAVGHGKVI